MKSIRIATRASRLALAQSEIIKGRLKKLDPDIDICILKITTRGDRDKTDFLYKSESVGLFTSEVERAVLDGRVDLAVHSLKDLPTVSPEGLLLAAIAQRHYVADVLVTKRPATSIEQLPTGTSVGTSSLRRIAQLKHIREDLNCVPLRGNLETRIQKVDIGQIDAIIVASAGLHRLGLADKISAVLAPEQFLTAPGQGALAIQVRAEDTKLAELVSQLDDKPTRIATEAERTVLSTLQGGCSIPLGVYARVTEGMLQIDAAIAALDGKKLIKRSSAGPIDQCKSCAQKLAQELLDAGGRDILRQIRANPMRNKN